MSAWQPPFDPHRRRLLRALSLAGITSLAVPALPLAQSKPDSASTPAAPPAAGEAKPPPGEPKPPEISEDARALAGILRRRYGQHLTPDQLESVTQEIENRLQGGRRLRDAKLANGDEPDATFHA